MIIGSYFRFASVKLSTPKAPFQEVCSPLLSKTTIGWNKQSKGLYEYEYDNLVELCVLGNICASADSHIDDECLFVASLRADQKCPWLFDNFSCFWYIHVI